MSCSMDPFKSSRSLECSEFQTSEKISPFWAKFSIEAKSENLFESEGD